LDDNRLAEAMFGQSLPSALTSGVIQNGRQAPLPSRYFQLDSCLFHFILDKQELGASANMILLPRRKHEINP
jgi:hypothetical protein